MSEGQRTRVYVRSASLYGGSDEHGWPPEPASKFTAWIAAALNEIPAEHRASATIKIGREDMGYDSGDSPTIEISYWRLETDEEIAEREAEWARRQADEMERERRTYLALKAKYG